MITSRIELWRRDRWICVCHVTRQEEGFWDATAVCESDSPEVATKIAQTMAVELGVPWGVVDQTGRYHDMVEQGVSKAHRIIKQYGLSPLLPD
jgi:hypothetical protein